MTFQIDSRFIKWAFALQPVALGAWFPRIPQIQAALDLSPSELAYALMGVPVGLLSALTFGGYIAEKLGTRGLLLVGMISYLVLMPAPTFAVSGITLFLALLLAGLALAIAELALNVTASAVEENTATPIMNTCHGFWSVGIMCGSAIGAFLAEANVAVSISAVTVSGLTLIPLVYACLQIKAYAIRSPEKERTNGFRITRPMVAISLFAFGIAMTEGSIADWIAIYLRDTFSASPGLAGAGYSTFALFVAAGRFQGDWLKQKMIAERLARYSVAVALIGLGVALAAPNSVIAYLGIALLGAGVSLGFPMAVSAVSVLPGRSSARNVAILTQVALCGFLLGPPMIGLVAEMSNMRTGLMTLAPPLILSLLLAGYLRQQSPAKSN